MVIKSKLKLATNNKLNYWFFLLIVFLILYSGVNLIWLFQDTLPPPFDQSAHILIALKFNRLLDHPEKLSLTKLLRTTNYWPPFFHFSAAIVTKIFGFSPDKVVLTNFLFLILLVIVILKIAQEWFNPDTALLALFLVLVSPLVYGLLRDSLIDFCLMTVIVWVQYLVIKSCGGWDLKSGVFLGLAMGLSLLTKWTSPAFFAFTTLLVFIETWIRQKRTFKQALVSAAIVIGLALALSLPWYLKNLSDFQAGAHHALLSDSRLEGDPVKFWPSLVWYLVTLKDVIISKWLLPFFGAGLIFYFLWVRNWRALGFCLVWLLPGLFVFVLIPNKDARFILPLFPALALISAAGLISIPWKKIRIGFIFLLILVSGYQFLAISFGQPKRIEHPYAFQAFKEDWPIEKILDSLAHSFPQKELALAVLANQPYFNPNIFKLFCAIKNYPYEVEEIGGKPVNFTQLLGYHFVILKTGKIALEHTARYRLEFLEKFWSWVEEGKKYPSFTLWGKWPLPDGSEALIYKIDK
ncbi:MAG: glycosyltransferase family 39 protein [Candidatus Aminicenantes bacterium]|nr:glycosyltransferase family 39 protein [Candidatus Aminicenantes bacterium]